MDQKRLFTFILFFCSLISCKRSSDILVEVKEVDFRNKTSDIIHGEEIISIPGVSDYLLFDSLLMFITSDPSGQLKVYNSNTMKALGSFCSKGRARNEFQKALLVTNQIYSNENGHTILPLNNYTHEIREIDVTESLAQGKTVIVGISENANAGEGATIYLDNNLDYRFEYTKNKYEYDEKKRGVPCVYTVIQPSGKRTKIKVFNSKMDVTNEKFDLAPYTGNLYKHPSRNLVVERFSYMEYLLFFDFDSDKRYAVHQIDALTFADIYDKKTRRENDYSFTDVATTENYLLLLYWRGDYYLDVPDKNGANEVLVFDWEGNYIKGFKFDRTIIRIEYDETHQILYALDENETLYKYDWKDLLP
ncbi:MAG: hypothetical protein IJU24_00280 [Bacteroidaceae bacterium]|nr:hypothetical protein [Bacteroidaceae bacterium]